MLEEDERQSEWSVFCVMDTSALFKYPEQVEKLGKDLANKEFDGKKGVDGKIIVPGVVRKEVNDYFYHLDSKLTPEEREVKKKYPELIQKQKERKEERKKILFQLKLKLFKKWATEQNFEDKKEKAEIAQVEPEIKRIEDFKEKVKKAKTLIDKELKDNRVWMLKNENPDIVLILTAELLTESGVYKKVQKPEERVENPAGNSDLIILATAMQLSRHGIAFVVTRDSGLANATIYVNKKLGYRRVIAKRNALGPWFNKQ